LIRFAHIILVLLTVAAYLPLYINPDTFWPIATLGLLAPTLWFLLLAFGIYWLLKRDKAVFLSIVALLLGWEMIGNAFAFSSGPAVDDRETVSILSLNGKGFREEGVIAFFQQQSADILLLQEFPKYDPQGGLAKNIKQATGLSFDYRAQDGQLTIFSRFPLKNQRTEYFSNRANGYLVAEVETPQGTWKLINVHLQTNGISHLANEVAQERNLQEKQTWQKIKTMFGRYARSNQIRTKQAEEILKVVQNSDLPIIVAGDLNDVPTSYLYQKMSSQLQDAHLARNWGLGTTFAGFLPGLRIDYTLPDPSFQIHDFKRIACSFSDHRAIRTEISVRKD
jgi:endonuclease/exonuclease/phosphatase (EEP) superfamily protein YafD